MQRVSKTALIFVFAPTMALLCLFFWAPVEMSASPLVQTTCPASPVTGLTQTLSINQICVYYGGNTTLAEAQTVGNHTQNYWNRYVALGFQQPLFDTTLGVAILNDPICNGGTGAGNYFTIHQGCIQPTNMLLAPEQAQLVTGHELFHRIQYSYDGTEAYWLLEGTARSIEDMADPAIDNWANALENGSISFNREADEYLANTNVDITSYDHRYRSALWWKYFTEQYGNNLNEPERGVDALVALWQAAQNDNDIAAVNRALNNLNAGVDFDAGFRRFVAANWIRNLTNAPLQFNYIDEDLNLNNPNPYTATRPIDLGTITLGSAPVRSDDQSIARYGARYYSVTPGANCPVLNATLHTDSGPAFYHVVAQRGTGVTATLDKHVESTASQWSQNFFNNGLTQVVAIAGSTNTTSTVDLSFRCVNPVLTIKRPNIKAVSYVGPASAPGKLLVQLLVTDGSATGPVVGGFTIQDFQVRVNGVAATITGGGFVQEQYWMVVQAPTQSADGVYDLDVSLQQPGSAIALTSGTSVDSVNYSSVNLDHVIIMDRSGSMADNNKLLAAQDAASFYTDIARDNDGLAVVLFNSDVNPAPYALQPSPASVRQAAKAFISGLTADGGTSIGDGLAEAIKQQASTATSNTNCSLVLLSDGMENEDRRWADVKDDVVKTGCSVTTIAFGPEADEQLMQDIADATGGAYLFNDVYVSSEVAAAAEDPLYTQDDMLLDLGENYEYIQTINRQQQRLFSEQNTADLVCTNAGGGISYTHQFMIDDTVTEAFFSMNWPTAKISHAKLQLRSPGGDLWDLEKDILAPPSYDDDIFWDLHTGHMGRRIANPQPGQWTLITTFDNCVIPVVTQASDVAQAQMISTIAYQVSVSARSNLTLNLLLPHRLQTRYLTGNRVPIYALLSSTSPIGNAPLVATITAPDRSRSRVQLYDDGLHGDGVAGDGLYGGLYTLVTQANAVASSDPGPQPTAIAEGSYRVRVNVKTAQFQREALGAFVVLGCLDTNNNDLPDCYEVENGVTNPNADPDLDGLSTLIEYTTGTDPQNSDTDGSGENDGCEVQPHGLDPLDPNDDQIVAPDYFKASPDIGANVLSYHVRPEYTTRRLYRATSLAGPWEVRAENLSVSGVYTDTAINDQTYVYRFLALDANGHCTALLDSVTVKPSLDPFPPEANPIINGGVPATNFPQVVVSFTPYEEGKYFSDIKEVKFSNDPDFTNAEWRPFQPMIPWTLTCAENDALTQVYALLRDAAGNESLIEIAAIRCTDDVLDSDGDGITDKKEGPGDEDKDNLPDYLDPDTPTALPQEAEPDQPEKQIFLPLVQR